MTGYTKLFGSIIASTIWRESKEIKVVWITLLAMANKNGIVEASVPGLADMARCTVEETRHAIEILEAPDIDSRTKENEGRRIRPVDGGWFILNHAKYRAKMGLDERREYNRLKQQEFRAANPKPRRQRAVKKCQLQSMTVIDNNGSQHNTEAQSEPKAEAVQSSVGRSALPDDAWVASLKANLAYAGIDVDREIAKCAQWCEVKHKAAPSRQRIVNWLNRCEHPIGQGALPIDEYAAARRKAF